ncbi:MAG: helix-turn-helix transcriptional regulator [Phycisphaerales bacterium]
MTTSLRRNSIEVKAPGFPEKTGDLSLRSDLGLTDAERRFLEADLAHLTEREREVVFALCDGGSNEAIAERLYVALPTLRTHLMRIHQKLGVRSKADVVRVVTGRVLAAYRSGCGPSDGAEGARKIIVSDDDSGY